MGRKPPQSAVPTPDPDRPGPSSGIPDWERQFREHGALWGDAPGELARAALAFLETRPVHAVPLTILDLGCGYGRDSIAYARYPGYRVTGIDGSETAILRARERARAAGLPGVEFQCRDLRDIPSGPYDVVHISNVYQVLHPGERREVREVIRRVLSPGGLLFLSTLSIRDPQQYGKGEPVEGDEHSFIETTQCTYIHFCTGEELARDFGGFHLISLREHEYTEARVGGDHHHISWILIARKPVS